MLPNHAPLVVAEQFALLEAAFPGRIDLGIGRAPGTDPVTAGAPPRRRRRGRRRGRALRRVRRHRARHDGAGRRRSRPPGAAPTRCGPRPRAASRADGLAARAPRTTRPGSPPRRACRTSSPTTSPAAAPPRRSSSTARASSPRERARRAADLPDRQRRRGADRARRRDRLALPQLHAMVALRTGAAAARAADWSRTAEAVDAAASATPSWSTAMRRPLGDRHARRGRGRADRASSPRRTASTR